MKTAIQNIFIALVLITLVTPIAFTLLDIQLVENCEKRELNKLPEFSFSEEFITQFENYFDDHFGLKNLFVSWGGSIKTRIFKSSIHPQNVKYGKGDWLFYNKLDGEIFSSYTNQNLLTQIELDSITRNWKLRKDSLAKKGIKYVMAVWPNKASIYPEYMPSSMRAQIKDTISKLDQIKEFLLKIDSDIQIIDVKEELLKQKKQHKIYNQFDTHWNSKGAFFAYHHFFQKTKKYLGIQPKGYQDFDVTEAQTNQGDLLNMLGICETTGFTESFPSLALKNEHKVIESSPGKFTNSLVFKNENCGNKLRVLIFRDSFTDALIPYFKLHFYETHFVWFDYQNHIVNEVNPDIVITSFVERNL